MVTNPAQTSTPAQQAGAKSVRLHYLDWLRVLAMLGVFVFHAVHPFDAFEWEIKNVEQSMVVTLFLIFMAPWGMPLFFLLSGAASWFALRRRTARQYIGERVKRLLIPFIIGSLLLSPIQIYFKWGNQVQRGVFEGSLLDFFKQRPLTVGPRFFGWTGFHLWFLGFLFAYALIGLPLFRWLARDRGRRFIDWLARLSEKRGAILLFIVPLIIVRYALQPLFSAEQDWTDFVFNLVFFVSGYILYADVRFAQAVRRDWRVVLGVGIVSTLVYFALGAMDLAYEWIDASGTPGFYLVWALWCANSWCWSIFMLYIGMSYLDCSNRWLQYGQEMIMPFFLFHQPVIVGIAFYVVQWDVSLWVKLPVVVLGSFAVSVGLYELIIKRVGPARALLGMKSR